MSSHKKVRSDVEFVPEPRSNTRTCVLCGCCGRSQFEYPRITEVFNCVTFKNGCSIVRQQLCLRLYNITAMPIYPRDCSDKRKSITKYPQQMKALVLHRRMAIAVTVMKEQLPTNTCIKYTILGVGGVPNPDSIPQLFSVGAIIKYILKVIPILLVVKLFSVSYTIGLRPIPVIMQLIHISPC